MLITLLTFIIVVILIFLLLLKVTSPQSIERSRLKMLDSLLENRVNIDIELTKPFHERILLPFTKQIAFVMTRFTPRSIRKLVESKINMAGGYGGLNVDQFLGVSGGSALTLAIITVLLASLAQTPPSKLIFIALVAAEVGLLIPYILLRMKITKRQKSMQRALADVLDLMTVSVEAGLGFDGALVKLTEKMKGALVEEFSRVLQEIRMGVSRREAFYGLGKRCDIPDISTFTSALIQADQLGASLGTVLRVQSTAMREARRQRTEEKAQKAPIYMLLPLVIFIFPVIFIVLLGPAVIQISDALFK